MGALSVSAGFLLGTALTDKNNTYQISGQRGKPVFFHADLKKIQRATIFSASVLETAALAQPNIIFDDLDVKFLSTSFLIVLIGYVGHNGLPVAREGS